MRSADRVNGCLVWADTWRAARSVWSTWSACPWPVGRPLLIACRGTAFAVCACAEQDDRDACTFWTAPLPRSSWSWIATSLACFNGSVSPILGTANRAGSISPLAAWKRNALLAALVDNGLTVDSAAFALCRPVHRFKV